MNITLRGLLTASSAALLLLLNGCMDLTQEYWVKTDKSTRVETTFSLSLPPGMLAEFQGKSEAELAQTEICGESFDDTNREMKEKGATNIKVSRKVTDEQVICQVSADFKDYHAANAAFNNVENEQGPQMGMRIEDQGKDARFSGKLGGKSNKQMSEEEKAQAEQARQMLAAMFQGKHMTVIVHAPKIGKTNGELSKDKKTVTWKVPFLDLMVEEKEFDLAADLDL